MAKETKKDDRITIKVPYVRGVLEDDIHVSINGKVTLIQRGVPVKVTRDIAEIIAEKERLEIIAAGYEKAQVEKSKKAEKENL